MSSSHLGGPGQEERRADDRNAEQHRLGGMREVEVEEPQQQAGDRNDQGDADAEPLSSRMDVAQVVELRGHARTLAEPS
jgi:hypothetical protein